MLVCKSFRVSSIVFVPIVPVSAHIALLHNKQDTEFDRLYLFFRFDG